MWSEKILVHIPSGKNVAIILDGHVPLILILPPVFKILLLQLLIYPEIFPRIKAAIVINI